MVLHTLFFWLTLLCIGIVYAMLGSIIAACVTLHLTAGIKLKVALVTYGQPLLLAIILLVAANWLTDGLLWLAAVVGIVIREFFSTRYYVTKITVSNNLLEVYCVTSRLKAENLHFIITDLDNIQLGRLRNWFDCAPRLEVKDGDVKTSCYIVDKGIYEQVAASLPGMETTITVVLN